MRRIRCSSPGREVTNAGTGSTGTPARQPDDANYVTTDDGLRLYYELHGAGSTTIVLLPPNPISHSRLWKAQVH
jgi:hypothetical protein